MFTTDSQRQHSRGGDSSGKCRTNCGPPPVAPRPTFDPNLHTRPPSVDLTDGNGIRNPTVPTEPTPDEDGDEGDPDNGGDDGGDGGDATPDTSLGCKAYMQGDKDNGPGEWLYNSGGGPSKQNRQNRAWFYQMYVTGVCPGFDYHVSNDGKTAKFDGHVSHAEGGILGSQLIDAKGIGYAKLLFGGKGPYPHKGVLNDLIDRANNELAVAPKSYPVVWYIAEESVVVFLKHLQLKGAFPPGISIIYYPCPESVCG